MNLWSARTNFEAYAEVEALDNYRSPTEIEAYRHERLRKYEPYVTLFRELGVPASGLDVVDIGAGSSAFLYALEQAGVLHRGLGIELSATRHEFAELWRSEHGYSRVENVNANFVDVDFEPNAFDRFSVLDDTYLYLRPEDDRYPELILTAAHRALRPNGLLVVDFRNDLPLAQEMPAEGRSFDVELPATNAYVSASYRQVPSDDRQRLLNESVYLSREGDVRRKVEITEVCDVSVVAQLAMDAGFASSREYGDLDRSSFAADQSPRGILVAVK